MDNITSDFIRQLRRRLDMTQEEFAHALGITVGTVNRWENGRFRPSRLARVTLMGLASRHGAPAMNAGPARDVTQPDSDKPIH